MSPMPARRVREYALGLRGAREVQTWGHPTFRVGGHIFASLSADDSSMTLHTSPEEQAVLLADDSDTFHPAPRVGQQGWTVARLAGVHAARARALLDAAWRRTAPASLHEVKPD